MKDAYLEITRIDARIRDKLLKRARKLGMPANQDEVVELVEARTRAAARVSKRRKQHKGH